MSSPCGTARREAILLLYAASAVHCLHREERGEAGVCACLPFFDDHSLSPSGFPSPLVSSIAERRGRREDLEGEEGCEPSEQVYGCGRNRPSRWANPAPTGRSCPASEFSLSDPASSGPPGPGAAPGTRRAAPGRPQRPWPPYPPLLLWERGCRVAVRTWRQIRSWVARLGGAPGVLTGFLIRRIAGRRRVQGAGGGRGVPVVAFAFFSLLSKNEICVFRLFRVFLLLRGCLLRKRKIASKMQNKWAELPPRATAGGISSLMARNIVKIQLKCNY